MLIKKEQAEKVKNFRDCTVWEYRNPSEILTTATALIDGRIPDKGRIVNLECEEIYYVVSGSGIIHSEFGDFKIEKGDVYHFRKKEKFWVEGKKLFLVLANSPKWYPEQHKNIE